MDKIKEYRFHFTDGTIDDNFNTLNDAPFYEDYEIVCTEPNPENAMIWYAENKLEKEVEFFEVLNEN